MSTECVEKGTLKRLGEEVSNPLFHGAIFNMDFILFDTVRNEVVLDIDMSSAFADRGSSIVI
jgi:hypothetical protein